MTGITQPIKWHGGKHYLAEKIIGLMPPRCKNPNAPPSGLYFEMQSLTGWNRHEFKIDNKAAGGKSKRKMTECVWTNF